MLLLPSEIKSIIAEQLVSSPNSLAALARTHSAYQREAEKALYNTLHVYVPFTIEGSLKSMETLATNSEKAALVRFLDFEYRYHIVYHKHLTMASNYLFKSLINMHSLSDFRVRPVPIVPDVNYREVDDSREVEAHMIKGLGNILWSVCKISDPLKSSNSQAAGDTVVNVIFDYKLFSATKFSTYLKSLRVKPNCRFLDYILVCVIRGTS
jgi:hypothetical protein